MRLACLVLAVASARGEDPNGFDPQVQFSSETGVCILGKKVAGTTLASSCAFETNDGFSTTAVMSTLADLETRLAAAEARLSNIPEQSPSSPPPPSPPPVWHPEAICTAFSSRHSGGSVSAYKYCSRQSEGGDNSQTHNGVTSDSACMQKCMDFPGCTTATRYTTGANVNRCFVSKVCGNFLPGDSHNNANTCAPARESSTHTGRPHAIPESCAAPALTACPVRAWRQTRAPAPWRRTTSLCERPFRRGRLRARGPMMLRAVAGKNVSFQLSDPASQPTRAASRWPYTREEGRSPFPGSSFSEHSAIARGLR